jgi:hypothetical protein
MGVAATPWPKGKQPEMLWDKIAQEIDSPDKTPFPALDGPQDNDGN